MYILLFTVIIIIETGKMKAERKRKHPASPKRKSEKDMMKEEEPFDGRSGRSRERWQPKNNKEKIKIPHNKEENKINRNVVFEQRYQGITYSTVPRVGGEK